ncbi:hypothetical protein C0J45_0417 [Silurus meridionalis]|uniref:Endonuclease/exonuclease/phosphatase domain-containing protein n=1 Tax=Silurus meridionalis TaxID=175797 RepID=A0A8T0BWG3_SILME|nr:hypothetical protein HF521_000450 [Silurus meridionalis]KAI5109020.1 hypothetical protein C0J45_0417 [Silurus meridionalis]
MAIVEEVISEKGYWEIGLLLAEGGEGRRLQRQQGKEKCRRVVAQVGTLNVGTMTGKGREVADMMERRKVDMFKGSKNRNIGGGFKLLYHGVDGKRNGVGVILKEEYSKSVVEVKRVSDRVMNVKLEDDRVMINVICAFALQVGCEMEEKEKFWSELDEVVDGVPRNERLVIGADFNGHVGEGNRGDKEVMGRVALEVKKRRVRTKRRIRWWKLKEEDCSVRLREEVRQELSGGEEVLDNWATTAEVIRETARKVLGVTSRNRKEEKETWWWNEEVQESIRRKRLAKQNLDDVEKVKQEVDRISKEEVRAAIKRMKSGKSVGPDDIPVEALKCLGEMAVEFLTKLFNKILDEKVYDRVLREELWFYMRKSGVSEKYVRVVQDMYEDIVTAVKCAVGPTDWFKVEVGLH